MHSNDGLKVRIEEVETDLLFHLRKYHELTSRGKLMKTVVDKEIRRLEQALKELGKYFNRKGSPPCGHERELPLSYNLYIE